MPKLIGVRVPHRKNTQNMTPIKLTPAKTAVYPMSQHIGAPAKPVVKVGDCIMVGQMVGEASGFVSSNIYSGVSGTVKKVDYILQSNGSKVESVFIEPDGLMTPYTELVVPTVNNYDDFIQAVKCSGVVGLGGAGFPTQVKLDVKDTNRIQEVVINGAECEPYITSDTITMTEYVDDFSFGLKLLKDYLNVKKIIIGIENNKPQCITTLKKIAQEDSSVSVAVLPSVYPQGGEKVLVYNTTGKIISEGKLPIDVGVVVLNCTTVAAMARYFKTGMPLVEKCITVDGSAVNEPKNIIAPIGTSLEELFEFAGGFKEQPSKVIYGGPMMGIAVPSLDFPVLKQTNAVLAFNKKDCKPEKTTACIRCGRCANTCPFNLAPVAIEKAYETEDFEALKQLKANLCMECGCCSFVCPAKRPLVQQNRLAKQSLANFIKNQKEDK